jgi:carbon storage regulator
MLVLSRRPGESILIGKDIEIVVLGSDGYQVRVGIKAPREVTVLRRELMKQVVDENRRAVTGRVNPGLGKALAGGLAGLPKPPGRSEAPALPSEPAPLSAGE